MTLVERAKQLAYRAHAGQVDKAGRPYIEHVARVAAAVADDPEAEAVAWLSRTAYPCDACQAFLRSNYGRNDVTADDWLVIEGAQADRWKITPNSKYRKLTIKDGTDILTVRNRLDVEAVCQRHDLFDEC